MLVFLRRIALSDRLQSLAMVRFHSYAFELLGNNLDSGRTLLVALALVSGRQRVRRDG